MLIPNEINFINDCYVKNVYFGSHFCAIFKFKLELDPKNMLKLATKTRVLPWQHFYQEWFTSEKGSKSVNMVKN